MMKTTCQTLLTERVLFCTGLAFSLSGLGAELRVPASTAYLAPEVDGARVSARSGITGWKDAALQVLWFGEFKATGALHAAVALRLPEAATSNLRLTIAGQSRQT